MAEDLLERDGLLKLVISLPAISKVFLISALGFFLVIDHWMTLNSVVKKKRH